MSQATERGTHPRDKATYVYIVDAIIPLDLRFCTRVFNPAQLRNYTKQLEERSLYYVVSVGDIVTEVSHEEYKELVGRKCNFTLLVKLQDDILKAHAF